MQARLQDRTIATEDTGSGYLSIICPANLDRNEVSCSHMMHGMWTKPIGRFSFGGSCPFLGHANEAACGRRARKRLALQWLGNVVPRHSFCLLLWLGPHSSL